MSETTATERGELLWEPSPEAIERSNMTRYMRWLEAERDLRFEATTRRCGAGRSTSLDAFWASIWDHFDVQADGDPATVLAEPRRCRAPSGSRTSR